MSVFHKFSCVIAWNSQFIKQLDMYTNIGIWSYRLDVTKPVHKKHFFSLASDFVYVLKICVSTSIKLSLVFNAI